MLTWAQLQEHRVGGAVGEQGADDVGVHDRADGGYLPNVRYEPDAANQALVNTAVCKSLPSG